MNNETDIQAENDELRKKVTDLVTNFDTIVNDRNQNFWDCQRVIDGVAEMYFQAVEDRNEEIQPFLASAIIELKKKTIMSNRIANEIYEETFDKEKKDIKWWEIEKKKSELIGQMSRKWSKTSDSYIEQLQSDFEDLEEQQKDIYLEGKKL